MVVVVTAVFGGGGGGGGHLSAFAGSRGRMHCGKM